MRFFHWVFLVLFIVLSGASNVCADDLSTQEILQKLKAHQDKIQKIEATFTMTIFGADNLRIEQTGTYTYQAPDQVRMAFEKPRKQVIKTKGNDSYISVNGGSYKKIPGSEKTAGMNNDLFYYKFVKQFYLDIDLQNKPQESNLYKVLGYHKNEDGTIMGDGSVLNQKAVEFIYDRNRGLITQMSFEGHGSMPPMEATQKYEQKNGCWIPKGVLTKVITPGGNVSSIVKMENEEVMGR